MRHTLRKYKATIKKDLPAGLVVFLVALPLCLGIALASGAPALSGIITGIVGGLIVGVLSGSALSVSGPAAGLTIIVINGITGLGSFEAFLLAVVLAGVFQLILGFAKAGIIGLFFPSSVIRGMLAAIGLTLILKQIPHFIGFDRDAFGEMEFFQPDGETTFSELTRALDHIHPGALLIGLVSMLIIVAWNSPRLKRYALFRLVPSALIAVVVAIILNLVFTGNGTLAIEKSHLVSLPTIQSADDLMRNLKFPDLSQFANPQVYVVAITIAIVASLETLLSLEAVDKLDPQKRISPTNRELKAQGVGNIISGLLGGLPMTAVIVRSSANVDAGGQTRVSAMFHSLLLLISLVLVANVLNMIPLAALAAVLLVVGFKLTKPALYKAQFRLGKEQFIPFIVTIIAILLSDLLKGIGVGMAVSIFYILRANYRKPYVFQTISQPASNSIYIKLSEHVSFLNKASIILTLDKLPADSQVVIDGENSETIDYGVLEAIHAFKTKAFEKNIKLDLRHIPAVEVVSSH